MSGEKNVWAVGTHSKAGRSPGRTRVFDPLDMIQKATSDVLHSITLIAAMCLAVQVSAVGDAGYGETRPWGRCLWRQSLGLGYSSEFSLLSQVCIHTTEPCLL